MMLRTLQMVHTTNENLIILCEYPIVCAARIVRSENPRTSVA